MIARQVKWIERNEDDPCWRIARLGGDGFSHTVQEAIINLHHDRCRYWMVHQGAPVWIVLDTRPGPVYLRTEEDIGEPDILLSLGGPGNAA